MIGFGVGWVGGEVYVVMYVLLENGVVEGLKWRFNYRLYG